MTTAVNTVALTIEEKTLEILNEFGLNFKIGKFRSRSILEDGSLFEGEKNDYFNLINMSTGTAINTVKEGYVISQNDEVVRLVLTGIEKFGDVLKVTKAGSLNEGRKVFIQIAIEGLEKVGTDYIQRFITIIDSNDSSCGLAIGVGDVTLSCQNQFTRFYSKADCKFRHSATLEQKMKEIPTLIEEALGKSMQQIEIYRQLERSDLSQNNIIDAMVKAVLGYDKHFTSMEVLSKKSKRSIDAMETLYNHIAKEIAQKGATLWGLHSGVTSYTTHELKAPKRENGQVESLLIGRANKMNQKSLAFVTSKAGVEIAKEEDSE